MDPKQLIKSVSALCLSQQVPSYNSKRAVETKQNKTKNEKQNIKTHRNNRNNPEKPSELRWSDKFYIFHGIQNLNKA